jgi:hypothetical protein
MIEAPKNTIHTDGIQAQEKRHSLFFQVGDHFSGRKFRAGGILASNDQAVLNGKSTPVFPFVIIAALVD